MRSKKRLEWCTKFHAANAKRYISISETGRQLGTRITEHRKEAEKISDRNFTRSTCRASTNKHYKSGITDHIPVRTMIYYELGSK